jgi:N-acetyl sugar amidotransferase
MKLKAFYGLPNKVRFCKKTLISNQRPNSELEFKHNIKTKKKTINIDKNGLSDAWKYSLEKKKIDYKKREIKLLKLLDKHRGKHGKYDCVVPGSGGKDSCYASHILKFKYGMNPLTVTWPPILYTTYGYKNFKNWLKTGNLDNITGKRNEKLMSFLTSSSIKNLLHPFQTFILGQKIFPIKVALKHKIPLVFYGDNEAEHGNPIADNATSLRNKSFHTLKDKDEIYLGGIQYRNLVDKYKFNPKDLDVFLPPSQKLFDETNIEVRYLGYYLKWVPQEVFYYSVKNCGFIPRPFRSAGTYSKYSGIDDKIDDLHFYTTYIKFGIGRATYDVAQELRNGHLSIEEGKRLIKKYDGEFPDRYFPEIMKYLNLDPKEFLQLVDKFRSPHLWKKTKKKWMLRYTSY